MPYPVASGRVVRLWRSIHLSKRKIDARIAGERVVSRFKRSNAMIHKARGAAPHGNIAAFKVQPTHRIGAALPTPQECRG